MWNSSAVRKWEGLTGPVFGSYFVPHIIPPFPFSLTLCFKTIKVIKSMEFPEKQDWNSTNIDWTKQQLNVFSTTFPIAFLVLLVKLSFWMIVLFDLSGEEEQIRGALWRIVLIHCSFMWQVMGTKGQKCPWRFYL